VNQLEPASALWPTLNSILPTWHHNAAYLLSKALLPCWLPWGGLPALGHGESARRERDALSIDLKHMLASGRTSDTQAGFIR
jgi:hypothetical protein